MEAVQKSPKGEGNVFERSVPLSKSLWVTGADPKNLETYIVGAKFARKGGYPKGD